MAVCTVIKRHRDGATVVPQCRAILESLPAWFGIPAALEAYVEAIARLPVLVAEIEGEAAGFVAIEPHNAFTSEVHVMAVLEKHHRHGIGRALIDECVRVCREEGRSLLEVKTLGPTHPDIGYARTRDFYASMGFLPIEESLDMWGPRTPCLIMVKWLG